MSTHMFYFHNLIKIWFRLLFSGSDCSLEKGKCPWWSFISEKDGESSMILFNYFSMVIPSPFLFCFPVVQRAGSPTPDERPKGRPKGLNPHKPSWLCTSCALLIHWNCGPSSMRCSSRRLKIVKPQSCSIWLSLLNLQLNLPSSIMVNHPWSCENVSSRNLANILTSIFKTSNIRYIKERPARRSPSNCSIHPEPRKSSCWHSKPRCWYTPIFHSSI